ncbi:MAG: glycoside hydrolase family 3 C-terminal domain-containing protein, partial [Phycisphaerae bacterium]
VMSAYNSVNGIPCSADHFLLTTLLRNRWGFRGYVTSDCDAVNNIFNTHHYVPTLPQAVALAMQAGCDLNCGKVMPRYLGAAVGDELVSEADISRAVTRLLTARVLLGELDPPTSIPYANISFNVVDSPAHRSVALQAARESIVLLKNDNNFLPLQKSQLKTVAVIGPMAGQCNLGGYSGSPFVKISPYDGIAEALGAKSPEAAPHKLRPKSGQPVVVFKPGCSELGPKDETMFAEAVDAARNADVVIMVCGVGENVDSEGHDRTDIKLTGMQHELIQACYKANPKTVLVISSNNTVAVNWEQQHLPAIVSAIFAGQAQGTAIADVLFGNYNPGGKTCCTWYKSVDQLPPFHNYDIRKGRTYMYFEGQPLYPFGYGLSYTTFRIGDLQLDSRELSETKAVKISCTVKNTGALAGAEVVQLYIAAPKSPVKRPIKELVGFQRVELQPGESRKITFTLPYTAQALWYWHESQRKFILQPGRLKLTIGNSSTDMALTAGIHLRACANAKLGGPETLDAVAVPVTVS